MELKPPIDAPEEKVERISEKPLAASTRLMLLISTTAIIGLFYLTVTLALAALGVLFLLDIALVVVLGRVGLAWFVLRPLPTISRLFMLLVRSLWLGSWVEYNIKVPRIAAPRLYEITEKLAQRIGVGAPDEIVVEMNDNAYVHLEGYRTGQGKSKLALGYDLIVTLTSDELETIIAHELAHAKLIQRGHRYWVAYGVTRVCRLAGALDCMGSGPDGSGPQPLLARALSLVVHPLGKAACRLYGTYSRQEEFAADQVAAEVCSPALFRSSMLRSLITSYKAHDLSWRHRIMHYHREKSFSDWLRSRLSPDSDDERVKIEEKIFKTDAPDEYSTHPLPADRLAMFPDTDSQHSFSEPAITLLTDPDDVAKRLIAEIERVVNQEEEKETRELQKWVKGNNRNFNLSGLQVTGVVLLVFGIIIGLAVVLSPGESMVSQIRVGMLPFTLLVVGLFLCIKCGIKEKNLLPAPPYQRWAETNEPELRLWGENAAAECEEIEQRLRSQKPADVQGKRATADHWSQVAYNALADCDYRRAWVASTICLESDPKSLEGLLARGISAAYFHDNEEAGMRLGMACEKYNLGPSVSWGLGWAFALMEAWETAEAYLLDAVKRRSDEPTVFSVLAACQSRRGKVHEAVQSARRAVSLPNSTDRSRILLARVFLYAGNPKDAMAELQSVGEDALSTYDGLLTLAHANLLLGNREEGDSYIERLLSEHPVPKAYQALGGILNDAEDDEQARRYWSEAAEQAFYPDALLGLAMLDSKAENKESERVHLIRALDLTQKTGPSGRTVIDLLPQIFRALVCLREPESCSAWAVRFEVSDVTNQIDHINLLVAAPDQVAAEDYIREIYAAMQPNADMTAFKPNLELLPPDQQPPGPVPRGIHNLWLDESG